MQGDFLVKMRTAYNQFTRAEKKVADYILQNPKEVLFMSITIWTAPPALTWRRFTGKETADSGWPIWRMLSNEFK